MPDEKSDSNRLQKWMTSRGFTDAEVAEMVTVAPSQVYRWRIGEHKPSLHNALKLMRLSRGYVRLDDWMEGK